MTNQNKGVLFALMATVGGGMYAIPYRLSLETAKPLTVVCGVFIWALVFSIPGGWIGRKRCEYNWKIAGIVLLTAMAGLSGNYFVTQALLTSSPTLVALLTRSEIILAMVLSWLFLKEMVSFRLWTAVGLILIGIVVMRLDSFSFQLEDWTAIIWALLTALSFAIMQVMAKSIIHKFDPQVLNCARLSVAIIALGSFPEIREDLVTLNSTEWLWISLAAFTGPFVGRVSYTYSLRYLSIAKAMAIGSFAPANTLLFQFLVFGTTITWLEALGGSILLFGILWVFLPDLDFDQIWKKQRPLLKGEKS